MTINLHVCYFRAEEVAGSTSDNGSSSPTNKDDSKTALIWGLSSTTSAIAKELLPESQLALSVSEELLGSIGGGVNQEEEEGVAKSLQPLSKAQGKKLRQLLLNIQDERVCQVCMNELTSSVFCPCGHHVACYHCAKQLDKCPVCRQLVGYVQYVYGSAWHSAVSVSPSIDVTPSTLGLCFPLGVSKCSTVAINFTASHHSIIHFYSSRSLFI